MDIESLPSEVLLHIFRKFALQPHEPGYPVLSEFKANRSLLLSLCLTTHKLAAAANTLLYETIIITAPSQLVSLVRTVSQSTQNASHVKQIACLLTLEPNRDQQFQRAWALVSSQISTLRPSVLRLFRLAGLAAKTTVENYMRFEDTQVDDAKRVTASLCRQLDHPGERFLATALGLVPSLQSVVFQPPHAPEYSDDEPAAYETMSVILDSLLADRVLGPSALQKLDAVKIQPESDFGMPKGKISCGACVGMLKAPNLTVFEGYHEGGGWTALPNSLRDVRLFGFLEPNTLSTVCGIQNLERLTVQPAPEDHTRADMERDVFNAALAKRASTLKYLQFYTMANESLANSYGPRKYLHCLGSLTHLEHLEIEIFALLTSSDNLDPKNGINLKDRLPRSLKTLILSERWALEDPALFETAGLVAYRDLLNKMLAGFAKSCASGGMPNLRKFVLDSHSDLSEIRRRADSPAMQNLKGLFAEAGVKMELGMF